MENHMNRGIKQYYQRNRQNKYGNSYYVMAKDKAPLNVLNDPSRFLITTFDQKDNYIVVGDCRYYLNQINSIKCTQNERVRIAIVDLNELTKTKTYPFKSQYRNRFTVEFRTFDELRSLAKSQWKVGGTPWIRQQAVYNKVTGKCKYLYELSCKQLDQFN